MREGQEVIVTALPFLSYLSLTANLMVFTEIGALEHPDHQPARHPGFIKEIKAIPGDGDDRVNTLL